MCLTTQNSQRDSEICSKTYVDCDVDDELTIMLETSALFGRICGICALTSNDFDFVFSKVNSQYRPISSKILLCYKLPQT